MRGSAARVDARALAGALLLGSVAGWADVCELSNNPHVVRIWLDLPTHPTLLEGTRPGRSATG